jgi:hypothetical protein
MEASADSSLQDAQATTEADYPVARSNPEEFRASLEAVRLAQEAANARARRQTFRARMIVVGVIGAVGLVVWSASARRSQTRQASIAAPAVTPVAMVAPSPIAAPASSASVAEPAPVAEPSPAVAAVQIPAGVDNVPACDGAFAAHQWPAVVTSCAAAFKTRPQDSTLAMRVAQAEHRRGHFAAAGDWARSAIALDATLPEAFVILAHAETRAGHPRAAATAYRRYLALAPHGWHATEARGALARTDGLRASTDGAL